MSAQDEHEKKIIASMDISAERLEQMEAYAVANGTTLEDLLGRMVKLSMTMKFEKFVKDLEASDNRNEKPIIGFLSRLNKKEDQEHG